MPSLTATLALFLLLFILASAACACLATLHQMRAEAAEKRAREAEDKCAWMEKALRQITHIWTTSTESYEADVADMAHIAGDAISKLKDEGKES